MTKEDDILAAELAKIGAVAGLAGGGIGGAIGGALGAGWVARLLPNDTFEVAGQVHAAPDAVVRAAFRILGQEGSIVADEETSTWPTLCAVVGSGFLNLNPALVRVQVEPLAADLSGVSVRGTAKEGLIKQHAGEKAARRIMELLEQAMRS